MKYAILLDKPMPTHDSLPDSLRKAQERGGTFFTNEDGSEWKLESKGPAESIAKTAGCQVHIFANNGFGDYMFLKKKSDSHQYSEEAFVFFHEGQLTRPVPEDLETLLGLKVRVPSADKYPKAVYETGESVQLGDRVQVKVWAEFWKGWQDGVVEYIPGISRKNPRHEYNGLKWVAIRFRSGQIGPLVDPKTGKLRKVKFVQRGSPTNK